MRVKQGQLYRRNDGTFVRLRHRAPFWVLYGDDECAYSEDYGVALTPASPGQPVHVLLEAVEDRDSATQDSPETPSDSRWVLRSIVTQITEMLDTRDARIAELEEQVEKLTNILKQANDSISGTVGPAAP